MDTGNSSILAFRSLILNTELMILKERNLQLQSPMHGPKIYRESLGNLIISEKTLKDRLYSSINTSQAIHGDYSKEVTKIGLQLAIMKIKNNTNGYLLKEMI